MLSKAFLGLLTYRAYTLDPKGFKPDVIHYNPGRQGEVVGSTLELGESLSSRIMIL